MRSSPARTGFTAWVENLAREQTEGLAAAAAGAGLGGDDAVDALAEALLAFLQLPQARALAEQREEAAALLAVLIGHALRGAHKRQRARAESDAGISPPAAEVGTDDEGATDPGMVAPAVSAATPSAATLIAAAEVHLIARGCAHKVAAVQRAVVRLRMLEELAAGEAARSLALRGDALAAYLLRAKDELQRCLAD